MTNIPNEFGVTMTAPRNPQLPYRASISKKYFNEILDRNAGAAMMCSRIFCKLTSNDNLMLALTVDLSFVKDKYAKRHYSKYISYLVRCNIIQKTGNKNSWHYLVNPEFMNSLSSKEQRYEYRKTHGDLFDDLCIHLSEI